MKHILILGAGTGGALMANLLHRELDAKQWQITVIDKADDHLYQPGFIFIPFKLYGYKTKKSVAKPIQEPLPKGVRFVSAVINLIDYKNRQVETTQGNFNYDWLVVAMGCRLAPEEVEGLQESHGKNSDNCYSLEGSLRLQKMVEKMNEGRFVLNIADMPIKCPVAPIEMVFLADYYFTLKGVRKNIEINLVTPLTGAFTKPKASRVLGKIAKEKNIKIVPDFQIESVDREKQVIRSFTGETVDYNLLFSIPPNLGPVVIEQSGLGDETGFGLTNPNTLKHKKADNIYLIGDNTNVPTSKAGSVAHFEAEIVLENILREIDGKEPHPDFDGHSNCFIESGFHKALLFDFNYDTEPLPGTFPLGKAGPFALLKETYLNHWGKMGFKLIYWNLLISGHLPGDPLLPSQMSMRGKDDS